MSINAYGLLYPDYVSVRPSTSTQGLFIDSQRYKFGIVDAVNYANIRTSVGNNVIFDSEGAVIITQPTNTWFIVHESDIIFKESVAP